MKQFVTVIIPVFNRKGPLLRSIKSVLGQTHPDFELLVIDDCSDDETGPAASSFNDKRIKYFRNEKNMGVSYSRNIGIINARHELIAFLDSDDEWKKRKLELQLEFLKSNPGINLVHTEEIWVRNTKRVNQKKRHKKSGGDIFIPSLSLCLMSPSSILLKKSLFAKYGLFDETLEVCEDYDMWLRILSHEKAGFIETPLVIKYGGHADQLSRKHEAMDRFRVLSLAKMLKSDLPIEKKRAVKNEIEAKLHILINGAQKRNKFNESLSYQKLLDEALELKV